MKRTFVAMASIGVLFGAWATAMAAYGTMGEGDEQEQTVRTDWPAVAPADAETNTNQYAKQITINGTPVAGGEDGYSSHPVYHVVTNVVEVVEDCDFTLGWVTNSTEASMGLRFTRATLYVDKNADYDFDDEDECLGTIGALRTNQTDREERTLTFSPDILPLNTETVLRLRFDGSWIHPESAYSGSGAYKPEWFTPTASAHDIDNPATATYAFLPEAGVTRVVYDIHIKKVPRRWTPAEITIGGLVFDGQVSDEMARLETYKSGLPCDVALTHTATSGGNNYTVADLSPVFEALRTVDSPITVTVQKGVTELGEAYPGYVPTLSAGFEQAQDEVSTDNGNLDPNDNGKTYNGKKYQWDLNPALTGDCWNLKVKVKLGHEQFNQWGICALASGTNAAHYDYTGGFQFYQNSQKNGEKGLTFLVKKNNVSADLVSLQSGGQNVYLQDCVATFELRYRKPEGASTGTLTVLLYTNTGVTVDQFFSTNITRIENLCGLFGSDTEIWGLTYNFVPKEEGIDNTPTTWLNNPNISLRLAGDYDGRYSMDDDYHALWCSGKHQQLLRVPSRADLSDETNRFRVPTSMVSVSPDAFANNTTALVSVDMQQYLMVNELLDSHANVSLRMSKDSDGEEGLMLATEDTFAEVFIDRPLVTDKWNTVVFPFELTAEESNQYFDEAYAIKKVVKTTKTDTITNETTTGINMVFDATPLNGGLRAGVPYVVKAKYPAYGGMTFNNKSINVLPDNPTFQIKTGNTVDYTVTLVGKYDSTTLSPGSGHYYWDTESTEGQWTPVTDETPADKRTIEGFRAHAVVTGTPAISELTMTRGERSYKGITVTDKSVHQGLGDITMTGDYAQVTEGEGQDAVTTLTVRGSLVLKGTPKEGTDARCLGWWMTYNYGDNNEYTYDEKITSSPEAIVTPTRDGVEYYTKFADQLTWHIDAYHSIKAHINDDPRPQETLGGCVTLTGDIITAEGASAITALDVPTQFLYNGSYYLVTRLDNDFLDGNTTVTTLNLPATIGDVGSRLQYPLVDGTPTDGVMKWHIGNHPLKGSDWNVSFKYTGIQVPAAGQRYVLLANGTDPTYNAPLFCVYVNDAGELHLQSGATHDYKVNIDMAANPDMQFDLRYNSGRMFLSVLADNGTVATLDANGVETVWTNDNYIIENLWASCSGTATREYLAYNFITIPTGYTYGPSTYIGVGTDRNHEADDKLAAWREANPTKPWPDWNTQNSWVSMDRSAERFDGKGIEYSLNLINEDATKPMDDAWNFTISATVNYAGTHYNGYGSCILATGSNPRASSYTNGFQLYITGANHRQGEGKVMVKTSSGDGPVSPQAVKAGDTFEFVIVHQGNANVAATSTTTYTVTQNNKVIYQRTTTDDLNNIFQFCTNMVEGNSIESFTIRGTRADMTQLVLNAAALETIEVDSANNTFESVNGILHSKGGQLMIRVPRAATGIITAHDNLVEVSSRAFDNNTGGALVGVTMAQYALIDNLASENTCLRLSQDGKGEQQLMRFPRIENRSFPVLTLTDRFKATGNSEETWNTFCLPFAISEELTHELFSDVRYLREVQDDALVFQRYSGGLEAGKPYIVRLRSDVNYEKQMEFHSKVFDPNPKNTKCGEGTDKIEMVANYDFVTIGQDFSEDDDVFQYFISKNKFYYADVPVNVRGYRAYFRIPKPEPEAAAPARRTFRLSLYEDWGTATDAEGNLVVSLKPVDVYDLNGKKVRTRAAVDNPLEGLPKGIYIINGKKVSNH